MKGYPVVYSAALEIGHGLPLSDFSFPWKDCDCPGTEFKAVWNEERLLFSFEVCDYDLVLPPAADAGQGALASDRVELFFASSPDLQESYYGAEMDPSGRVYDYAATFYRKIDPAWKFSSLQFEGEIVEEGYRLQGSFSMAELQELNLLQGREIIAGVYRAEFSHGDEETVQDWISWVDPGTEKPDFHVPSSFGKFVLEGK
ncbi:MAG: sugar-binding protein [Verrucomicrobiales bacterium]|nr:sugar-binding protein [Verrucomicrobiales bacterium]